MMGGIGNGAAMEHVSARACTRSAGLWLRRGASGLAIVAALAVFDAAPAGAAPAWLPPQDVFSTPVTSIPADPFFNRRALTVASDSSGNSVAAWIEEHPNPSGPGTRCQAMWALRPAGGSFGAPESLAPAMAFCTGQISLAMNPSGTAVVAWKQGAAIDAAIRDPGGVFGAASTLSASTSTDDPWVSINDDGMAVASWDDTDTGACASLPSGHWAFHASVRQPDGGFGPFETVCDAPHASIGPTIFTPRTAIDPQGDVVATWVNEYSDGSGTNFDVEWAYRPAGGSFTGATPQVLTDMLNAPGGAGSYAADVGIDAEGRATAVWPFNDGTKTVIRTAVRPAGPTTSFGSTGTVSDPLAAGNAGSPRLAIDPTTNDAVAAWVQCPSTCQVEAAARASGAGFQAPQALSAPGASANFGPEVAFDPSGSASVIWSGPSPDIAGTQVQATSRPPGTGQSFGAVTTISTDDPSLSPALAFDGEGNAIAVWEHDTTTPSTGAILQYAGYDAAPPDIQSVSSPNGVAGEPLSFSADVSERWSTTTITWDFGDGAVTTGANVSHTYTSPGPYHLTVTALDAVGNESSAGATVSVGCPAQPPATLSSACPTTPTSTSPSAPTPAPAAAAAPAVTGVTQTHAVWREGRAAAELADGRHRTRVRAPLGTTFGFTLNTAAAVRLTFTQRVPGRMLAGRCVAVSRRSRHGRRCTRTKVAGALTFAGAHAGSNRVSFQGRLSQKRKLRPGRYRLVITASNGSGRATSPSIGFRIVRR
jgi:hypothetical protein